MSPNFALDEEDLPSKAIWDPTTNSSTGSVASSWTSDSTTTISNSDFDDNNEEEKAGGQAPPVTSTQALVSETELRLRILQDKTENKNKVDHDDDCMSAMLMSNISSLHGPSGSGLSFETDGSGSGNGSSGGNDREANHNNNSNAKYNRAQNQKHNEPKVPKTPAQRLREERHMYIHSYLSHLTDKQLKTQLWDSFRLARVVLNKPIKGKRKPLSRNATLHAIQKVAEMRIQILSMAEELDDLRQQDKLRHLRERSGEDANCSLSVSSSLSTASSHLYGTSAMPTPDSKTGPSPSPSPSVRDSTETTGADAHARARARAHTPTKKMDNLRQHAIQLLQQECDLASDELRELEQQWGSKTKTKTKAKTQNKKAPSDELDLRDEDAAQYGKENTKNDEYSLLSPKTPNASKTSLFLPPSSSSDEDDRSYSYNIASPESAEDILFAFTGNRRMAPAMATAMVTESPESAASRNEAYSNSNSNISSHQREIRSVLQKVVALREEQQRSGDANPEITTNATTSTSTADAAAIHDQVISLLTRLSSSPSPSSSPQRPSTSPGNAKARESPPQTKARAKTKPRPAEPTLVPADSLEVRADSLTAATAELEARLSIAKKQKEISMETVKDFSMQKQLLQEDIAKARANTTPNRTELQLERLEDYKTQVRALLEEEELRAKQIASLDENLSELAHVCVVLEDTETEFREKHERHQRTLDLFRTQTHCHSKRFRSLLETIDKSILEQHAKVFGETNEKPRRSFLSKKSSSKNKKDVASGGGESSDETIRQLEYLLTKRNAELFTAKAQLKEKKQNKRPTRGTLIPNWSDG